MLKRLSDMVVKSCKQNNFFTINKKAKHLRKWVHKTTVRKLCDVYGEEKSTVYDLQMQNNRTSEILYG